jgi:hypothetical protein
MQVTVETSLLSARVIEMLLVVLAAAVLGGRRRPRPPH